MDIQGTALVVDDDATLRTVVSACLEGIGLEVKEAHDGAEALRVLEGNHVDVVLLDVEMPGADGFQVCGQIRGRRGTRDVPVLMLTGLSDPQSARRALEAGASDFETKPINPVILQHRVRFLLRAAEASQQLRSSIDDLDRSQHQLESAQRLARVGSWQSSSDRIFEHSSQLNEILGLSLSRELPSLDVLIRFCHQDDRHAVEKMIAEAEGSGGLGETQHRIVTASGEQRIVHHQVEAVSIDGERRRGLLGTIQDVTDRAETEERIRSMAFYDSLTGLPNRRMLTDQLTRAVDWASKERRHLAVIFVDLDRFKLINDTFGHGAGDEILLCCSDRIVRCVRGNDVVGRVDDRAKASVSRFGGDEFAVLFTDFKQPENAKAAAERIISSLRQPLTIGGREIHASASAGVALYPENGASAQELMANADAAMCEAKRSGRDGVTLYNVSMTNRSISHLELDSRLRNALERDEFVLQYQPIVDAETGMIVKAEALARWMDPETGLRPPSDFLEAAEASGLIIALGERLLELGCRQAARWGEAGHDVSLCMNVTAQQLRRGTFPSIVRRCLEETGLDASKLDIELVENSFIGADDAVNESIQELAAMGIGLAIDDFGTGYSCLEYLHRLPVQTLKVDRSFISRIGTSGATGIVAAIVAMAHRLGLTAIAEGIETAEQEDALRAEGCDLLQGFRYSRPVDPDVLIGLLGGSLRERADRDET